MILNEESHIAGARKSAPGAKHSIQRGAIGSSPVVKMTKFKKSLKDLDKNYYKKVLGMEDSNVA
jgi:hypothetical protein